MTISVGEWPLIDFNPMSGRVDGALLKAGAAMAVALAALLPATAFAGTATTHQAAPPPGWIAIGEDDIERAARGVTFSDGNDTVTNTETLVLSSDYDLGGGDDRFINQGVVRFAKADAPLNLSFLGLERFANDGGLIDLRNEGAGDVLTLSGDYAATGNARVALDIDGQTADSLVINGVATGRTSLVLQSVKPENAVLLDQSLTLVTVGEDTEADAFSLANADQGLVRYRLSFDDEAHVFQIDASAGLAVHQSVRATEGLRFAWRASAEAFDTEQAMARASGGEGSRVWAVAHGVQIDRESGGRAFALGYEQALVGGQMGASLGAVPLAGGQAAYGVMGGYVDSSLTFEGGGQVIDMQTFNLGVYGAWRREKLFATGLIKFDRHALEIEDKAAGFASDLDGQSWGARFEAGYRFDVGVLAIEPVVGLDYLSTSLDDLEVLGQSVVFDDQEGFSGRLGGQALAQYELTGDRWLVLSLGIERVHDFDADLKGALHSNQAIDEVVMTGPENYGRTLIGAQLKMASGLQAYIQGEGRFGDGQSGGGLRLGARYRF